LHVATKSFNIFGIYFPSVSVYYCTKLYKNEEKNASFLGQTGGRVPTCN